MSKKHLKPEGLFRPLTTSYALFWTGVIVISSLCVLLFT